MSRQVYGAVHSGHYGNWSPNPIARPAMNLRGISGGDVGAKARNAIQPSASASIGLRLVPAQTPEYLRLRNLWDAIEIYAAVLTGL